MVWCMALAHGWRRKLSGLLLWSRATRQHRMDLVGAASAFAFRPDTQSRLHTHSVLSSGTLRRLDWLFRRGQSSAHHIFVLLTTKVVAPRRFKVHGKAVNG